MGNTFFLLYFLLLAARSNEAAMRRANKMKKSSLVGEKQTSSSSLSARGERGARTRHDPAANLHIAKRKLLRFISEK